MSASPAQPPWLAERLVALLVRDARWREVALGDLLEEFNARVATAPVWRARVWYWFQAFAALVSVVRDAVRALGSTTGDTLMTSLAKEARFAIRSLVRQPLMTGIILATIALTVASNAVVFGMVDRMVLRPFPIRDVDRLVLVSEHNQGSQQRRSGIAAWRFFEWRQYATVVTDLVAFSGFNVNFSGADQPERIDGQRVTAGFFELLGAPVALGRPLRADDEIAGQHRVVVISDALWRRRFDGDPTVLGRTIRLDGNGYEVVGVAQPGFVFPEATNLWVPFELRDEDARAQSSRSVSAIGRLPDGRTLGEAQFDIDALLTRQQASHPEMDRRRVITVFPFAEGMVDNGTPLILRVLQIGAFVVLLVGCTNIASLLLARGSDRHRELAVRLALGAGRGRIVRQLLMEGAVLALSAMPMALATAWVLFHLLRGAVPPAVVQFIPGWTAVGIDARVVLFAFGASLLASVAFSLVPALVSSRVAPSASLRDGGRSVTSGRHRLRRGLVVVEIALTLPLLVASGMTVRTGQRLAFGPQGYNPDGLYQLRTVLTSRAYPDDTSQRRFAEELLDAGRQLPGVKALAITSVLPSNNMFSDRAIAIDGEASDRERPKYVSYRTVSPAFFETMQIPLLSGRAFTAGDRDGAERVSIVTESLVRRYFGGRSPLGRRVRVGTNDTGWTTVVGVSKDTIDDWINGRTVPTLYVPFAQSPGATVNLVARADGDASQLGEGLRRALAAVDPDQPAFAVQSVGNQIRERTSGLRMLAGFMAGLGGLALILAALGIYGLMSSAVAQRKHEFGVRMALGASATDVLALTIRQGATLTAVGVGIGVAAAVVMTGLVRNALFGILDGSPMLLVSVTLLLTFVAFIATVVPARRATTLDPAVVLKE